MNLPAPRDALFLLASCIAVAVAAFSAGRFTAPLEVDHRFEYSELERRTEKVKTKKKRSLDTITTITPVVLSTPDGGVLLSSKTVTETRERTEELTNSQLEAMRKAIGREEITTTNRPDWRFTAFGGARFSPTGVTPLAGGMVERRIFGGVSLMAGGAVELDPKSPTPVTAGQAVIGASLEF